MNVSKRIVKTILVFVLSLSTLFSLLGIRASATSAIGKVNISMLGKYDSADTATIRAVDTQNKTIKFRNHALGKDYTLSYDNTSMIYDAYGSPLSASLLEQGQIVDVTFLKSAKKITILSVNKDAWYVASTRDHDLVRNDGTAVVKGSVYKIDPRTMVIAENKPALAEDVLSTDSISVSGMGKDIYSVVVTGGHGYVSLSSDVVENQSLVGAWLELDNAVIHKISPNMLLSAPEGDYNLQIIGNGANYQSKVNVARNQETVIDTSNVTIARPKEGLVTFEIVPDTAEVFVDGTRMLSGVPQTVVYGYHNLKIMAEGYETQTKYLKVGTPKSVISIELEKIEDESTEEASDSDTSATSATSDAVDVAASASTSDKKDISSEPVDVSKLGNQTVSGNSANSSESQDTTSAQNKVITTHRIYIDEPNGAEVYFDGNYIGIVPTHVTKVSGTHEIIVKKDGYETKSYRINIDSEETDLSYRFPDMVRIRTEEPAKDNSPASPGTVSGNDAKDNASTDDTGSSSGADAGSTGQSGNEEDSDAGNTNTTKEDEEGATDSTSDEGSTAATDAIDASDNTASGETSQGESGEEPSGDSSENSTSKPSDGSSEDEGDKGDEENLTNNNEEAGDAANTASASSDGQ